MQHAPLVVVVPRAAARWRTASQQFLVPRRARRAAPRASPARALRVPGLPAFGGTPTLHVEARARLAIRREQQLREALPRAARSSSVSSGSLLPSRQAQNRRRPARRGAASAPRPAHGDRRPRASRRGGNDATQRLEVATHQPRARRLEARAAAARLICAVAATGGSTGSHASRRASISITRLDEALDAVVEVREQRRDRRGIARRRPAAAARAGARPRVRYSSRASSSTPRPGAEARQQRQPSRQRRG
ncbi:MAG: hypothetical protein MZV65_53705 [Chromatiales bacterium]|nr:hypothetical protein [Chromatiales bacterium]